MKNIIGLTGPTGSGKSSFSLMAKEKGMTVIDCDKISREVTKKNGECLEKLKIAFGNDIVNNGELDRKLLASRAFSDSKNKSKLEEIIFPFIIDRVLYYIDCAVSKDIILDAPTLFESGIDELCSSVVAVIAPFDMRKERIINRDNLSEEQAVVRMNAGKPDSFYYERTDYVINNNGAQQEFLNQCEEILKKLTEE
ncbi:MAG: dephospho-CoA kinase [Acutalibacteraceae bacterium]|nr:dephospho-CoA kinase [Acutalibacteraceae bacterium]